MINREDEPSESVKNAEAISAGIVSIAWVVMALVLMSYLTKQ